MSARSPKRHRAHAATKERKVRRWMVWAALALVILTSAFLSANRLLARTNEDKDPTVVGGLALIQAGATFASPPAFGYVGNVRPASGAIGAAMFSGPKPMTVRLLISNVIPEKCEASNGAAIIAPPTEIGIDTQFYSLHQAHQRKIYMFDVSVPAHTQVSVSCNVTDAPERETYTTRRIAFAPPLNADILSIAGAAGFQPVLPMMVSIQRVTESTSFITLGGEPVHNNTIGSILEASYLTRNDPILRAFWADERARSFQTFWLFTMAALAGLGFALIVEAVRPLIERVRL